MTIPNQLKQVVSMKGNELGWLIKLAHDKWLSEEFQKFVSGKPKLHTMFIQLFGKFHQTRFYAGTSEKEWSLAASTTLKRMVSAKQQQSSN